MTVDRADRLDGRDARLLGQLGVLGERLRDIAGSGRRGSRRPCAIPCERVSGSRRAASDHLHDARLIRCRTRHGPSRRRASTASSSALANGSLALPIIVRRPGRRSRAPSSARGCRRRPAAARERAGWARSSLEQRQDLAAMHPPGQAEILAQRRGRQVGRAGGDERLVAIDREVRRQRDLAVSAGSLEIEVAVERAVEEARQVSCSRASRAPGRGPRDTSGPGRPTTRPASCRASPTLSVGRLRKARISSRRTPASGSSAIGEQDRRDASARPAAAWPRASGIRRCHSRGSRGRACARPARGCVGRPA